MFRIPLHKWRYFLVFCVLLSCVDKTYCTWMIHPFASSPRDTRRTSQWLLKKTVLLMLNVLMGPFHCCRGHCKVHVTYEIQLQINSSRQPSEAMSAGTEFSRSAEISVAELSTLLCSISGVIWRKSSYTPTQSACVHNIWSKAYLLHFSRVCSSALSR